MNYNNRRYCIAVSWKEQRPTLPNNHQMALSSLRSTKQNVRKNEFVKKEYQETIEAYVKKGYLHKVAKPEDPPPEVWYLPQLPIVRMNKSIAKMRIIFDCSAKCDGISLNDAIHVGPKLQKVV